MRKLFVNISLTMLILTPYLIKAQQDSGLHFIKGLTWSELKAKAKAERKFIFLDVNATWCAPCRKMEKEVFPRKAVGELYDAKFLSASVQTDQTPNDGEDVKKWYADAKEITSRYTITAIPTYLYFSPDGELLHRSYGYQPVNDFLALASTAIDPQINFASMKKAYANGTMNPSQKRELAISAFKFGDKAFAEYVARNFNDTYLKTLSETELLSNENLDFIKYFYSVINSSDNYFSLFYLNEKRMDSLLHSKGASRIVTNFVITKEEITNKLWNEKEPKDTIPNWTSLERIISEKYNRERANGIILQEKYRWYRKKANWSLAIKYGIELMEFHKFDADTTSMGCAKVNDFVWNTIFKYGKNENDLNKGLVWMENIVTRYPKNISFLDTYANLLYKHGEKQKAIEIEKNVLNILAASKSKYKEKDTNQYLAVLEKMKSGIPTW